MINAPLIKRYYLVISLNRTKTIKCYNKIRPVEMVGNIGECVMKKKFLLLIVLILALVFTSCNFKPEEDFSVSSFLDMKTSRYKLESYKFSSVGELLGKEENLGNAILAEYRGNSDLSFVAAKSTENSGAYDLWNSFAQSDEIGIKQYFSAIPLLYASYNEKKDNYFIRCWFKDNWFFRIEAFNEDEVNYFYDRIKEFTEKKIIINGSVSEI